MCIIYFYFDTAPQKPKKQAWLANLAQRLQQLEEWGQNPSDIPKARHVPSFCMHVCVYVRRRTRRNFDKQIHHHNAHMCNNT